MEKKKFETKENNKISFGIFCKTGNSKNLGEALKIYLITNGQEKAIKESRTVNEWESLLKEFLNKESKK